MGDPIICWCTPAGAPYAGGRCLPAALHSQQQLLLVYKHAAATWTWQGILNLGHIESNASAKQAGRRQSADVLRRRRGGAQGMSACRAAVCLAATVVASRALASTPYFWRSRADQLLPLPPAAAAQGEGGGGRAAQRMSASMHVCQQLHACIAPTHLHSSAPWCGSAGPAPSQTAPPDRPPI